MPKYPNAGWIFKGKSFIRKHSIPGMPFKFKEEQVCLYELVPDLNAPETKGYAMLTGPKPLDSEVEYYCFGRMPSVNCNPSLKYD